MRSNFLSFKLLSMQYPVSICTFGLWIIFLLILLNAAPLYVSEEISDELALDRKPLVVEKSSANQVIHDLPGHFLTQEQSQMSTIANENEPDFAIIDSSVKTNDTLTSSSSSSSFHSPMDSHIDVEQTRILQEISESPIILNDPNQISLPSPNEQDSQNTTRNLSFDNKIELDYENGSTSTVDNNEKSFKKCPRRKRKRNGSRPLLKSSKDSYDSFMDDDFFSPFNGRGRDHQNHGAVNETLNSNNGSLSTTSSIYDQKGFKFLILSVVSVIMCLFLYVTSIVPFYFYNLLSRYTNEFPFLYQLAVLGPPYVVISLHIIGTLVLSFIFKRFLFTFKFSHCLVNRGGHLMKLLLDLVYDTYTTLIFVYVVCTSLTAIGNLVMIRNGAIKSKKPVGSHDFPAIYDPLPKKRSIRLIRYILLVFLFEISVNIYIISVGYEFSLWDHQDCERLVSIL